MQILEYPLSLFHTHTHSIYCARLWAENSQAKLNENNNNSCCRCRRFVSFFFSLFLNEIKFLLIYYHYTLEFLHASLGHLRCASILYIYLIALECRHPFLPLTPSSAVAHLVQVSRINERLESVAVVIWTCLTLIHTFFCLSLSPSLDLQLYVHRTCMYSIRFFFFLKLRTTRSKRMEDNVHEILCGRTDGRCKDKSKMKWKNHNIYFISFIFSTPTFESVPLLSATLWRRQLCWNMNQRKYQRFLVFFSLFFHFLF